MIRIHYYFTACSVPLSFLCVMKFYLFQVYFIQNIYFPLLVRFYKLKRSDCFTGRDLSPVVNPFQKQSSRQLFKQVREDLSHQSPLLPRKFPATHLKHFGLGDL